MTGTTSKYSAKFQIWVWFPNKCTMEWSGLYFQSIEHRKKFLLANHLGSKLQFGLLANHLGGRYVTLWPINVNLFLRFSCCRHNISNLYNLSKMDWTVLSSYNVTDSKSKIINATFSKACSSEWWRIIIKFISRWPLYLNFAFRRKLII